MTHERLEPRRLLADDPILTPTMFVDDGIVFVRGTDNPDTFRVRLDGGRIVVEFQNVARPKTVSASGVTGVDVDGLSGGDRVEIFLDLPMTVRGSNGNDRLFNRTSSPATLIGGNGTDRLSGGPSRDRLDSSGDDDDADTLVGLGGNDLLILGTGREVLDYGQQTTTAIRFASDEKNGTRVEIGKQIDTIANDADLTVIGTTGNDVFLRGNQGSGSRRFVGGLGNDTFVAGTVVCEADGGEGNDSFTAAMPTQADDSPDQMFITGGAGDDEVQLSSTFGAFEVGNFNLGDGSDALNMREYRLPTIKLFREQSAERLLNVGRNNPMTIEGNDNSERIIAAGQFPITVMGGGGEDTIEGSSKADLLDGGPGFDRVSGNGGNDTVLGGDGRDTVSGGSGIDSVSGGTDDDYVYVRDGRDDSASGGDGTDHVQFDGDNMTFGDKLVQDFEITLE